MILVDDRKVTGIGCQVTLPAVWRKYHEVKKGDSVVMVTTDEAIVIVKKDDKFKERLSKLGIELDGSVM